MNDTPPWRLMSAAERRRSWLGTTRLAVPGLTTLALVVLMTAPLLLPIPLMPQLALLAVFVWSTFVPGLMPPWLAFLIGLAADLLYGQPLGLDATLFAATALFVRLFEARYGHHVHGFDWAVASAVTAAHAVLTWWMMAFAGQPVPLPPLLWPVLTTTAAYPLVVWLCGRLQARALG